MNVDPLFIHISVFLLMLMVLQVGLLILGISGPEVPDAPDADAEFDLDVEGEVDADIPSGGVLDFLGIRGVPIIIWLSAWIAGFAATGFFLSGLFSVQGPNLIVRAVATVMGFVLARILGRTLARLIPNVTTSAVSLENARSLMGEVTDGVASKGRPARVEVFDGKGGVHYFMAEPADADEQISAGEKVALILVSNPETGARERRIVKL